VEQLKGKSMRAEHTFTHKMDCAGHSKERRISPYQMLGTVEDCV